MGKEGNGRGEPENTKRKEEKERKGFPTKSSRTREPARSCSRTIWTTKKKRKRRENGGSREERKPIDSPLLSSSAEKRVALNETKTREARRELHFLNDNEKCEKGGKNGINKHTYTHYLNA